MEPEKIQLVIDGPKRLTLARAAEYLREFAALLGNEEHVHFAGILEDDDPPPPAE